MEIEAICRRYHVVAARPVHVDRMAGIMRESDRQEVWAAAGLTPSAGLEISLASSLYAWTWLIDDIPACMFGIGSESLLSGVGMPWLLSADPVDRHRLAFLKYYRPFLARMRADFPLLVNWVDARYAAAIRWLGWMGFTLYPAAPYGPFGMPHHRFEMRSG
ncbi:MAG TPA: hypothetical protein VM639_01570 [Dongiaceae bacterium]|nr:hypothetical protein [Dongiaceae bacterium]